jgi:hypothetical protein
VGQGLAVAEQPSFSLHSNGIEDLLYGSANSEGTHDLPLLQKQALSILSRMEKRMFSWPAIIRSAGVGVSGRSVAESLDGDRSEG